MRGMISVAVWLVRSDEGWIQVDAGAQGFEAVVMEQVLKQTGGAYPQLLILTHGHMDHAAAAAKIHRQWKVRVAAGRAEIPYLIGPEHYNRLPGSLPYHLLQFSSMPMVGLNVQLPLDTGMRVGPLEVFVTPGHTPGHVALLHAEDRALICGDVFRTVGGKVSDPQGFTTYNAELNFDSQARLSELDFDHLLASHGPPLLNEGCAGARALVKKHVESGFVRCPEAQAEHPSAP